MEAIEQIPKTALDVFKLLPEGTLCEVIDNILYMSPAPKYNHQRLTFFLARSIANLIEGKGIGEAMVSPIDVYFENLLSAVQPDILVLLNENRHILKEDGYIHGAPDVIIEILSGDVKRDTITKKALYEKAGVKEYFIANPANRSIQGFVLADGVYTRKYEAVGNFNLHCSILNLSFNYPIFCSHQARSASLRVLNTLI